MSLTETQRHWLCGYWLWTADSKSVVNVAIPHLRGRWSPTKAILRIFPVSFKRFPLVAMFVDLFRHSVAGTLNCSEGKQGENGAHDRRPFGGRYLHDISVSTLAADSSTL